MEIILSLLRQKRISFLMMVAITLFLFSGCANENDIDKANEEVEYKYEGSKQEERFESLDEEAIEKLQNGKYKELINAREDKEIDYNYSLDFDVIVVGTDPEGISAALASARSGKETLLIDERSRLGGLMTKGALNTIDMNYNPDGKIITRGIFMEFFDRIEGDSFRTGTAEEVFLDMVQSEANLTWKKEKNVLGPIVKDGNVQGIKTLQDDKLINYGAKRVIDATQNGDMSFLAGAPYTVGLEDAGVIGEFQVSTLVFKIENLNWNAMANHLNRADEPSYRSGSTDVSAWGFLREMQEYESSDPDIRMRGLNLGREGEDSAYINALHIFGVDPLDDGSIKKGREKVKAELPDIVDHMRENLPGFEDIELVGPADEFYLREGRHIQAEYQLTINDVREHRDFWDKIAFGSYPVDLQPTGLHNTGFVLNSPKKYSVPFRSLVPQDIDDMLVVGKAAGFDSLAHGSARVIPVGMTTGEAAGVAADYSIDNDMGFREISKTENAVEEIQAELTDRGAYLEDFDYSYQGEGSWTQEGIRFMNSLGLVYGGYDNEFGFDERITGDQFHNMLRNALVRSFGHREDFSVDNGEEELCGDGVSKVFLDYYYALTDEDYGEKYEQEEYFNEAGSIGIFKDKTLDEIEDHENPLRRDEIYALIKDFVDHLKDQEAKDDVLEQVYIEGEQVDRARFYENEDEKLYLDLKLLERSIDLDQVFFDYEKQRYLLRAGDLELQLPLESSIMVWNNEVEKELDSKFTMYNGRPMLSLEDFVKFTGYEIEEKEEIKDRSLK